MCKNRCTWANTPLSIEYHDHEWGTPVHDDRTLFEFLILEGAQAGLSWETILKKRAAYRIAYDHFDPEIVARYDEAKIAQLINDPAIIRNRRKINASIQNARAYLKVQGESGSFDRYLWRFVDNQPIQNHWQTIQQLPAQTPLSLELSKELVKRGFTFVGPTICYAFMQAVGLVNDHTTDCFRHKECAQRSLENKRRSL